MDNTSMPIEELNKLYELARNARNADEVSKAIEYYQKIAQINSGDWEAYFYSYELVYYPPKKQVNKYTRKSIEDDMKCLWAILINTVKLIAAEQGIDKSAAVCELYYFLSDHYMSFFSTLKSQVDDLNHTISSYSTYEETSPQAELGHVGCIAHRYATLCYGFGDYVVSSGLNCNTPSGVNVSADCWNIGNNMISFSYAIMAYPVKDSKKFITDYTAKIRQYAPSYQPPVLPNKKNRAAISLLACMAHMTVRSCGLCVVTVMKNFLKMHGEGRSFAFIIP